MQNRKSFQYLNTYWCYGLCSLWLWIDSVHFVRFLTTHGLLVFLEKLLPLLMCLHHCQKHMIQTILSMLKSNSRTLYDGLTLIVITDTWLCVQIVLIQE